MKIYRPNVSVIAKKDNLYLIVKKPRKLDSWQFPQGGVEENESFIDAAKREFIEEIGTNKINFLSQSKYTYKYKFDTDNIRYYDKPYVGQIINFFYAEFIGKDTDINLQTEELCSYKWVTIPQLREYFLRKEYLNICYKVIKEFPIHSS